jgi:hypothetical protein
MKTSVRIVVPDTRSATRIRSFAAKLALVGVTLFLVYVGLLLWPTQSHHHDGQIALAYITIPVSLLASLLIDIPAEAFHWSFQLSNTLGEILMVLFGVVQYTAISYAIGLGLGTIYECVVDWHKPSARRGGRIPGLDADGSPGRRRP